MYAIARIIRGFIGFLAGWQILGIFTTIMMTFNYPISPGELAAMLILKTLYTVIFMVIFFGLRALINKVHTMRRGIPHPSLTSRWAL